MILKILLNLLRGEIKWLKFNLKLYFDTRNLAAPNFRLLVSLNLASANFLVSIVNLFRQIFPLFRRFEIAARKRTDKGALGLRH